MPEMIGRFAPTPSGYLHPGNLLCAMLAYLSVRAQGGRFSLRIEDLDKARCPRHLVTQAIQDLEFLGITWDFPILYQSERQEIYQAAFDLLRTRAEIYPCFCSRADLHASLAPNRGDTVFLYPGTCRHLGEAEIAERRKGKRPAYRIHVPDTTVAFHDRIVGPFSASLADTSGDFILMRADGVFAYNLAVVVDDALTGVTEVVRGNDILTSTPCQIYLQDLLGYERPEYAHIPLLVDEHGERLAKRNQVISLAGLLKLHTREEIIGALAYACGLLPENQPATLEALIPLFRWSAIAHSDFHLPAGFLPAASSM